MATERMLLPRYHGRDHKLKGPDPASLSIDSTATAIYKGIDQSVHSAGADTGDLLTADGSGGSVWAPPVSSLSVEFLSADNPSIGSATQGSLTFSHVSGATLVDLSTATAPAMLTDGDYEISGMVRTVDNVNTGRMVRGVLVVLTSEQVEVGGTSTADASTAGVAYINVSCALKLAAGDTFELHATNHDSSAHHFAVGLAGVGYMAITKR